MLPVKCIRIYAIKSLVLQPDGAQSYRNKTRNLASELKIKVTDTYYSTQISPTVTMPQVSLKSAQRLLRFDLIWLHRRQVPGYPASNWIAVSLYFPDRKEGFWSSVTSSPAVSLSVCRFSPVHVCREEGRAGGHKSIHLQPRVQLPSGSGVWVYLSRLVPPQHTEEQKLQSPKSRYQNQQYATTTSSSLTEENSFLLMLSFHFLWIYSDYICLRC